MTEKQTIPLWELVVFVVGLLVSVVCFYSDPPLIFRGLLAVLVVVYMLKKRTTLLDVGDGYGGGCGSGGGGCGVC